MCLEQAENCNQRSNHPTRIVNHKVIYQLCERGNWSLDKRKGSSQIPYCQVRAGHLPVDTTDMLGWAVVCGGLSCALEGVSNGPGLYPLEASSTTPKLTNVSRLCQCSQGGWTSPTENHWSGSYWTAGFTISQCLLLWRRYSISVENVSNFGLEYTTQVFVHHCIPLLIIFIPPKI